MRGRARFIASNILITLIGYWIGRWSGCNQDLATLSSKNLVRDRKFPNGKKPDQKNEDQKSSDRASLLSNITLVSFCIDKASCDSLERFIDLHPGIEVQLGVSNNVQPFRSNLVYVNSFASRGEALNELISKVETRYFLHLDSHHEVDTPDSAKSVDWLFQTMERLKSLDLIGGSVAVARAYRKVDDTLEIPCYRLHHYNYTYWETFEFKESFEDVMLCERTSTTFLANTTSFKQYGLTFDPHLGILMFEDFFLQAKMKRVVVATKPDVYFSVPSAHNNQRSAVQHVTTKLIPDVIPFGLKHHVMVIKDIDGKTLYICERYSTMGTVHGDRSLGTTLFPNEELLCDYDKTRPYWKMKHWAYGGMFSVPTMRMALKRSMALAGEFFDSKNWSWALIGGGALGAAKTRGFLPWEAGDIDIHINTTSRHCADVLEQEFVRQHPDYKIEYDPTEVIIKPKRGFGGWVTIFFGKYPLIGRTVRMDLDGYWVAIKPTFHRNMIHYYTVNYLQHKMHNGVRMRCLEKSNSCLPDFRLLYSGRGGMWREFFGEVWGKSTF